MPRLALSVRVVVIVYLVLLILGGGLARIRQFSPAHLDADRRVNAILLVLACVIAMPNLLSTFPKTQGFLPIALIFDAAIMLILVINVIAGLRTTPAFNPMDAGINLTIIAGHAAIAAALVAIRARQRRPATEGVFD